MVFNFIGLAITDLSFSFIEIGFSYSVEKLAFSYENPESERDRMIKRVSNDRGSFLSSTFHQPGEWFSIKLRDWLRRENEPSYTKR